MTALPKAPEIVLGLINVEGQIIPVVDFRRRFRLREREIELSDHLVIADTAKRRLALVVDEVIGTFNFPIEEVTSAKAILPQMEYVEGVGKLNGELILIHDLDKFLTLNEEAALDGAMG
jgi:purine-binding chemotaxis protein CheW